MLIAMKIELTADQKITLEAQHRQSHDRRVCDRIRCVLLSADGWTPPMIAHSQLINETTVRRHLTDYHKLNKLKPENGGSDGYLNAEQTTSLVEHLTQPLYHHNHQIVAYIAGRWNITFTVSGLYKGLKQHGFSYKKPKGVPHKFDVEKQPQFIKTYSELKDAAGNDPILFIDAVHPTQATKISYGWIRKGQDKTIETTGSRTRLNIMGALNIQNVANPIIRDDETINSENVVHFLSAIRAHYPITTTAHVILEGAGYHRSQLVQDAALTLNIQLHYLPPYSPNLNPIERLWKVMNEQTRKNRYYPSKQSFKNDILNFFEVKLPQMASSLVSRLNDNFQALNPAS
ncbi:IS630 family transposase [Candidatus Fukatsuia symbiotica]|uniref:IS630 family transposase n=2 Tax=Candidatus Fukatsuia symbiotica TaxID=1878942 RepID=A0A2U8I398_9GAMM|nr:IS630 family transposase [Candidatus Fukatsuia symbiotica]